MSQDDGFLDRPSLKSSRTTVTTNPDIPPYDVVKWIDVEEQWIEDPLLNSKYTGTEQTAYRRGTCSVDSLLRYSGSRGERRRWRTLNKSGTPQKIFGKYTEDKWNHFLELVKNKEINGRVLLFVDPSGHVTVADGNHRREASIQLGLKEVPVEIRYFGNSNSKITVF